MERDIVHNIILVLTNLDTFSSSFKSYSDTENPDLNQNSQKKFNKTSKENKGEFSSGAWLKENVFIENLENVNGSNIIKSKNLKENEHTTKSGEEWEKHSREGYRGYLIQSWGGYAVEGVAFIFWRVIKIISGKYGMFKNFQSVEH